MHIAATLSLDKTVKPHLSALYCSKTPISGQARVRYPPYPPWHLYPQPITDQITDQNTPYCGELDYAVCNDIRVLAVIRCCSEEMNTSPVRHQNQQRIVIPY